MGIRRKPQQRDGFRSGLETTNARFLQANNAEFEYEAHRLYFVVPARIASYRPDFVLPNGIVLETKGLFEADDRHAHLLIKEQHPDLDIRFVFSRSASTLTSVFKTGADGTKTRRNNPTTYADWCRTHGFKFSDKIPPLPWITEPFDDRRWAAIHRAEGKPNL